MTQEEQEYVAWLKDKGHIQERPFTSSVPLFGPLIVRFRSLWNSVAAKWYTRPIVQQQNEFNALLVEHMSEFERQMANQIVEQDRDQTRLLRETAVLSTQLAQLNRLLDSLDERLARLEEFDGTLDESEEA